MQIAILKPTEQYHFAPREDLSHVFLLTSATSKLNIEALVFLKGGMNVICLFLVPVKESDFFFFPQENSFLIITQY